MSFYLSAVIFVLVTAGVFCLLQPNLMRMILGMVMLSNAGNLILFVSGGLSDRTMPLVPKHEEFLDFKAADPVPQALVLTAIVIGFGILAYFLVLCRQYYKDRGEDNLTARSIE